MEARRRCVVVGDGYGYEGQMKTEMLVTYIRGEYPEYMPTVFSFSLLFLPSLFQF